MADRPTLQDRQAALTQPAAAEAARDRTEDQLNELFSRAMRKFLGKIEKEVRARVNSGAIVLTAAGEGQPDPITLGQLAGWWADIVDQQVMAEIITVWQQAYAAAPVESAVREAVETYLPRVRDRLVRGDVWIGGKLAPSVAEDSFDRARTVLARSAAQGWTRQLTAERLATALGWETDGPALRSQLDDINSQIDAILDPLGHPGSPGREYARLHDPLVRELQADRADLIKQLDAEKSYWQNRAELIARTESTSLHNYGANRALIAEGFTHKKWLATSDQRTRESHREANGQIVPVDGEFIVGGFAMQFPGDPSAPVGEIANCRCCVLGADKRGPEPDDAGGGGRKPPPPGFTGPPDENDRDAWRAYWQSRQDALPIDFGGDTLDAHEVEFVERFLDAGERMQWIPRDETGRLSTNDFTWLSNGSIEVEVKSPKARYETIMGDIHKAVRKALKKADVPGSAVKENFIIDIGEVLLTDDLERQLAGYNIDRSRYQIARLWVMTLGRLVEIELRNV